MDPIVVLPFDFISFYPDPVDCERESVLPQMGPKGVSFVVLVDTVLNLRSSVCGCNEPAFYNAGTSAEKQKGLQFGAKVLHFPTPEIVMEMIP